MKVHYTNDFKITDVISDKYKGVPFTFVYQVGGVKKEVSFDGENYEDCALVKDKTNMIEVIFDNHNMPCGQMTVHRYFEIADATYPDGARHEEVTDSLNVYLVSGNSEP